MEVALKKHSEAPPPVDICKYNAYLAETPLERDPQKYRVHRHLFLAR